MTELTKSMGSLFVIFYTHVFESSLILLNDYSQTYSKKPIIKKNKRTQQFSDNYYNLSNSLNKYFIISIFFLFLFV